MVLPLDSQTTCLDLSLSKYREGYHIMILLIGYSKFDPSENMPHLGIHELTFGSTYGGIIFRYIRC
jgi:hypothetical protein